jgi:hypothetical protein
MQKIVASQEFLLRHYNLNTTPLTPFENPTNFGLVFNGNQ